MEYFESAWGNGKIVLIVSTEPELRRAIMERLKQAGYGVISVSNGLEACRAVQEFHRDKGSLPAIVITANRMPPMHGPALISGLRELGVGAQAIILLEAGDDSRTEENLRLQGWHFIRLSEKAPRLSLTAEEKLLQIMENIFKPSAMEV